MIYQFHRAPGSCRASFRVNDLRLLFTEREGAEWLSEKELEKAVPDVKAAALAAGVGEEEFRALSAAAENGTLTAVNADDPHFTELLKEYENAGNAADAGNAAACAPAAAGAPAVAQATRQWLSLLPLRPKSTRA